MSPPSETLKEANHGFHRHPGTDPCLAERNYDHSLCSQRSATRHAGWLFRQEPANAGKCRWTFKSFSRTHFCLEASLYRRNPSPCWLCPIQSDSERRGILQMTRAEYLDLVEKSGRMLRSDKRGAIDADLAPILLRISANPEAWLDHLPLRSQIPSRRRPAFQTSQICRSARPALAQRRGAGSCRLRIIAAAIGLTPSRAATDRLQI
jgi:hypothetical protein